MASAAGDDDGTSVGAALLTRGGPAATGDAKQGRRQPRAVPMRCRRCTAEGQQRWNRRGAAWLWIARSGKARGGCKISDCARESAR